MSGLLVALCFCFLFSFSGDKENMHTLTAMDLQEHWTKNGPECKLVLDVNPRCVRILQYSRTSNSGFGHQLSELIQSMHISYTHAAALKFSGFGDKVSRHGHVYNFADSLLGLDFLSKNRIYPTSELTPLSFNDTLSTECNVLYEGNYKECPGGDCFRSPFSALLLDQYKHCLRHIAYTHGDWNSKNPFNESVENRHIFRVVWHIRLGDLELHSIGDEFYQNVHDSLSMILQQMVEVQHYFIAEWSIISDEKKQKYLEMLNATIGCARLLDVNVQEAFTHMMHSDLLVGSGSTLPIMAAAFSNKTTYVNVKPKIDWNFLNEYLTDGLSTTKDGRVINHVLDILRRLHRNPNFAGKLKL